MQQITDQQALEAVEIIEIIVDEASDNPGGDFILTETGINNMRELMNRINAND